MAVKLETDVAADSRSVWGEKDETWHYICFSLNHHVHLKGLFKKCLLKLETDTCTHYGHFIISSDNLLLSFRLLDKLKLIYTYTDHQNCHHTYTLLSTQSNENSWKFHGGLLTCVEQRGVKCLSYCWNSRNLKQISGHNKTPDIVLFL